MKDWEVVADNLSEAGWSWGCVSAIDTTDEHSRLLTHIGATESVTLCAQMKS
jgi:hypothetical protein